MESFWAALKSAGGAGGAMYIILGFSVLAIFVAMERLLVQWKFTERARALADTVNRCLLRGAVDDARSACERSKSPLADVFLVGFERRGRTTRAIVDASVHRERARMMAEMRRRLWILGTIGATSPFVGLFGTVIGIIRALGDIAAMEEAGFAVVAGGIYEALWATALGIAVAVEAVIIFNYFNQRIGRMGLEVRMLTDEFLEHLHEHGADAGAPAEPEEEADGDRAST
jgi:biopolymer transport protein ExbB/TolQ